MDFIADDFPAIGAALAKLEGRVEPVPDPLDSDCRPLSAQAAQKYANALGSHQLFPDKPSQRIQAGLGLQEWIRDVRAQAAIDHAERLQVWLTGEWVSAE